MLRCERHHQRRATVSTTPRPRLRAGTTASRTRPRRRPSPRWRRELNSTASSEGREASKTDGQAGYLPSLHQCYWIGHRPLARTRRKMPHGVKCTGTAVAAMAHASSNRAAEIARRIVSQPRGARTLPLLRCEWNAWWSCPALPLHLEDLRVKNGRHCLPVTISANRRSHGLDDIPKCTSHARFRGGVAAAALYVHGHMVSRALASHLDGDAQLILDPDVESTRAIPRGRRGRSALPLARGRSEQRPVCACLCMRALPRRCARIIITILIYRLFGLASPW